MSVAFKMPVDQVQAFLAYLPTPSYAPGGDLTRHCLPNYTAMQDTQLHIPQPLCVPHNHQYQPGDHLIDPLGPLDDSDSSGSIHSLGGEYSPPSAHGAFPSTGESSRGHSNDTSIASSPTLQPHSNPPTSLMDDEDDGQESRFRSQRRQQWQERNSKLQQARDHGLSSPSRKRKDPPVDTAFDAAADYTTPFMMTNQTPQHMPISSSMQGAGNAHYNYKAPAVCAALPPESIEELLEEADLKRRRLARKAELARASRKQKKDKIDELQTQVAEMQQELEEEQQRTRHAQQETARAHYQLAQLRAAAAVHTGPPLAVDMSVTKARPVKAEASVPLISTPFPVVAAATVAVPVAESATPVPAGTFSQPTHDALAVAIKAVLSTPATDAPAASDAITNMVSAAREQSVADALAVEQVARHGEQCLPASFLEWFLSHGDAFYEDPNGLWQMVIGEGVVAADAKQMQGVLGLRAQAAEARAASTELQQALAGVRDKMAKAHAASSATLQGLVSQLSTTQLLAFFRFVNVHGSVCIKINKL